MVLDTSLGNSGSYRSIIAEFAERGYNIHPEAVEIIRKRNFENAIDEICKVLGNCVIITPEDVLKALEILNIKNDGKVGVEDGVKTKVEKIVEKFELKVRDITGRSSCEGVVDDFIQNFSSRYEKIRKIFRGRINSIPIASLKKVNQKEVSIIGIVTDVRETSKGNYIIEIEDKTGKISVLATAKLREVASELLGDEVIAVSGSFRNNMIIANRIVFPDVPQNDRKVEKDFGMVFISDIHFGSNTFLEKSWNAFVKWLNCEVGNEYMQEIAEKVRYLFIAGDVVDGVGIYPGQEKELEIFDIYGQYEEAGEQLEKIPKRIKIILSPGNHDAVRQAEPQPALPKEFADLFPRNVKHVGNPAWVDADGVKVLIYHGRSIDDMIMKIPRLDYSDPSGVIEEMLKRRHLCPIYGGRTPLAPEKEDLLVIDEVPDIVHTGHVHTYGARYYRGILALNSSTWQAQTEFQKKVNLNPMPGNVPVYVNGKLHRLRFYRSS
ncbi:DNA polymerase II small subunit [Archaeoglobus sulfaticallidus PM70-1]|uniref:DNA polymerase II small subunit n=1 Tax=Archaeoglobus sulfaticallidus PM70-1 TaxID=387631 RepID=N0BDI9_9EURY|nr:DNA-directed DNA polymerase II small subunit [Archaeoglobus sulfaticallidus]AGK61699.1 DNA polymerase II small subunit [Archaeoglobus sulfaticallidus PM70-1]